MDICILLCLKQQTETKKDHHNFIFSLDTIINSLCMCRNVITLLILLVVIKVMHKMDIMRFPLMWALVAINAHGCGDGGRNRLEVSLKMLWMGCYKRWRMGLVSNTK